jgi:5-methylcytosine-specific restriction endonuclease McrA
MLSNLFKLAVEKLQDLKATAPDVKRTSYACRSAYASMFDNMFMNGLSRIIQSHPEMKNDNCNFNNLIYNKFSMNRTIGNCNSKYEPTNNETNNFTYLNSMSEATKNYITKLCDIVLDDNYDISSETDNNVITYYRLLKFIPIYFEMITNCYNIYDDHQRMIKISEFEQLFQKIIPRGMYLNMHINIEPDYYTMINIFKENVDKPEMKTITSLILKYYKDMMKIKKYTESSKKEEAPKEVKEVKEVKQPKPVKEVKSKKEKEKGKEEDSEKDDETEKKTSTKKKKEKIPSAVRKIVWNTYIGKDNTNGKCLCCDAEDISSTNFECGHIKSEKNGGQVNVENLRPICGHCNKSIGGNNMDEFMERYKIKKPSNWNGLV